MLSAFGVDHGEVSKARVPRLRGITGPKGQRLTRAQRRTAGVAGQTLPQRTKGALNRVGEANISIAGVGRGTSKAGQAGTNFIERHPGLTGAGLIGGGGYAGYRALSQREPKRKRPS